ncbi:MAG TPA: nicotinamide riboside transporter PnuC [Pirellulaceae bacterium]|nr:nicotinamide riboside transporter PnuC [Pirellulaceae bacterium]
MSWLEIIASALGLVCVWLTIRRHIGCWPTGLAMVILYIFIFYRAKLYSDMLLQVVYVPLQIYGWYAWLRGGPDQTPLVVSRLPAWQFGLWLVAGAGPAHWLGHTMDTRTDAAFPYIDAIATIASLIAQWLMGRKVLESWLVWIFVDVLSIGLYLAKELYPTAILYCVLLILATWGWFEWKGVWKKQATA